MAKRRYPMSGGATQHLRSSAKAEGSQPASEARGGGWERPPCVQGQGLRPGGATLCPRRGVAPEERGRSQKEQPHIQGVVAARVQEGLEEPSHTEGQEGWGEEIPLIQGKEQRLRFTGAAVKRYPTTKVRETQVRR